MVVGASGVNARATSEGCRRHQGAAARNKRVPFLLYDNVGPIESVLSTVSPCEVCAKPAEL